MSGKWSGGTLASPQNARATAHRARDESGFTLIELIIVCTVLPMVVGAISFALVSVLSIQGSVSNRISDSADAQVVSTNFEQDVQSAAQITSASGAGIQQCGPGTQILGMEWNLDQQSGVYQTVVSYVITGSRSPYSLVRQDCTSGPSSTPTGSTTISFNVALSQSAPAIMCGTAPCAAAPTSWIPTASAQSGGTGVTGVTFVVAEPKSSGTGNEYTYTLVAVPGSSGSSIQQATVSSPTSSCGFATPGTGTYASNLCFVSFANWNTQVSAPGVTCTGGAIGVSAAIVKTSYTLTFCLSASGGPVAGTSTPTWSGAFLGNQNFYLNIPGDPALYQTIEGNEPGGAPTTVTISNIKMQDSNGNTATGWQLVTGDAETTDAGESMTWTASWNGTLTVPASKQILSLLPDSNGGTQAAEIGNACQYSPAPSGTLFPLTTTYPGTWLTGLTGVGSKSVECASTVSSQKFGTVMVQAPAPTGLTVYMVGTGLEGMFLGVLLS